MSLKSKIMNEVDYLKRQLKKLKKQLRISKRPIVEGGSF